MSTAVGTDRVTRQRQRLLWLGGAAIVAMLVLVVWTQLRQFGLLTAASRHQDDYLQVSLGYLESEYLRLRLGWNDSLAMAVPDRAALQLRYDIFVSRVALLETKRSLATVRQDATSEAAYRQTRAFIDAADHVLGRSAPPGLTTADLERLRPALEALAEPIHTLVVDGSHQLSEVITQRTAAMRATNRNTLQLTLLLALVACGFGLLSIAQFRRLDERRLALEQAAEELSRAQQQAVAANSAKSNFLANMSHEIRTPLQGVLGMLALLSESPLSAVQQQRLQTARDSADHLLVLLNDILDLTKLEAGKLAIMTRPVDLPALLEGIDGLMRAQAVVKGLRFEVGLAAGLPRWLELDPTRVRQIMLNLCSNAIKFTDAGQVKVLATAVDGRLRLVVDDTGIGIDDATLGQLFKRFSRGDETRARQHGGTGLGLEISRQLAQRMGGDITVTSQAGRGSCFIVDLPLQPLQPPAAASAALAAAPAAEPAPAPATPSLLVLVADDNEVNRSFTGAVLEHLGHRVIHAEDGAEAVAMVRGTAVDLVLMDLHMPGIDGLEATRTIRQLGIPRSRLPIIALTADAFNETEQACLSAGMDAFVAKPVSPDDLRRLMAGLMPGLRPGLKPL